MADKEQVPVAVVHDAGRTEVSVGTLTVLAVGPATVTDVNKITGRLRLL